MKKLLFIFLMIFSYSSFALSLSGDDWKNPLRTKTWTPPSITDTLVGKDDAVEIKNKTIDFNQNTILNQTNYERMNALNDPSFEKNTTSDWSVSGTGSISVVDTDLKSPKNTKMLEVNLSTSGQILANWTIATPPTSLQAVCRMWVKTPSDLTLTGYGGTGKFVSKTVKGTNTWQFVTVEFTTSGSLPSCRIANSSAVVYNIDEVFFGPIAKMASITDATGANIGITNIELPNGSATKLTEGSVRVETGFKNLLTNYSFEALSPAEGWTCSGITPIRNSGARIDGKYGLMYLSSASLQGCLQYVDVPTNLVGQELEYSIYVTSTIDIEVCSLNDGLVSVCKKYDGVAGPTARKITITDRPKNSASNSNGIIFRTINSTTGFPQLDLAYVGLPQSTEAALAKFDNTTGWKDVVLSATGNQNYVIENSQMIQSGLFMHIKGKLSFTGAGNSAPIVVTIPNGLTASLADSTGVGQFYPLDVGINAYASPIKVSNGGKAVTFYRYYVTGVNIQQDNLFPFVASSGDFGEFYFSIPIAEWSSQTNTAIINCSKPRIECTNYPQFTYVSGATTATDQFGNSYPITKSGTGNLIKAIKITPLNLKNSLKCVFSLISPSATTGFVLGRPQTNVESAFETYSSSNTSVDNLSVTSNCVRQGDDFDEALDKIAIFAGATGQTIDMRGPRCPFGTLPEDGRNLSTTEYSALFNEIGYTYGGAGALFRVPDSRGKANMGSISIPNATGTGTPVTNNATFTGHQFNRSGIRVRVVSGTLTGLATNTDYYTIYIDNNTLAFATTYANAIAGTKTAISGTNSVVIRQSVTDTNTAYGNEIEDTFQGHVHDYYGAQSGTGNSSGAGTSAFRPFTTHGIKKDATNGSVRFGQVTAPYHLVTTRCIKY